MSIDDAALVKAFRMPGTKKKAFETIVHQYNKQLFFHLSKFFKQREDIEDLLQIIWVNVWRGLENFRGDCKLSTWLHTIATREAYNKFRENKRVVPTAQQEMTAIKEPSSAADLPPTDAIEAMLLIAIEALPEKQRQVFIMRYFEEKPYDEISQITGTSVGALKASYHHAVKKIENHINPN